MRKIASVLILTLLLVGCSTTLSLEDQAKLVEYEKCLEYQFFQVTNQITLIERNMSEEDRRVLIEALEKDKVDSLIEDCKEYRP